MCDPVSTTLSVFNAAKAVATPALKLPAPPKPEKPPQAAKAPDLSVLRAAVAASMANGTSSTLLTGPMGVDPGSLSIGRNTLLGS